MRVKSKTVMEHIRSFAMDYIRQNGHSPTTCEIAAEVGVARGTAHTYLVRMNELGMIQYDGKNISSPAISKICHNTIRFESSAKS